MGKDVTQVQETISTGQRSGLVQRFLDKQTEKRIDRYVERYAKKEDGTLDEPLAQRIRWEVSRRAEAGKQLDIYEPLRWTAIRTVMGAVGAGIAKVITGRLAGKNKTIGFGVEIGIVVATVINSVIDLTRLYPRWLAGLEGGKNTALMLHHKFGPHPVITHAPPDSAQQAADSGEPQPIIGGNSRGIAKKPSIQPTSLLQHTDTSSTLLPPL